LAYIGETCVRNLKKPNKPAQAIPREDT
jgi:hypothetical protein